MTAGAYEINYIEAQSGVEVLFDPGSAALQDRVAFVFGATLESIGTSVGVDAPSVS